MKSKFLLSTMAMAIVMTVLVGCKGGNNAPDSPSIIDAVCDMYGKSLSKAISIAKSNGFSYIDEDDECAIGLEKDPYETEVFSPQLSMCAKDGSVIEVDYMINFKGNNQSDKVADFARSIGTTREVDGEILVFYEGIIEGSSRGEYTDFDTFLQHIGNSDEVEAYWTSDKTGVYLFFEAEYEDGYTYLDIQVGKDW